jgi:hypothetical protein
MHRKVIGFKPPLLCVVLPSDPVSRNLRARAARPRPGADLRGLRPSGVQTGTHARALLPAALASVPFGFVLVRVRVRIQTGKS